MKNNIPEIPEKDNFSVDRFYSYTGPNFYLDRPAMVFNLFIKPNGHDANFYKEQILAKFPILEEDYPQEVAQIYAKVLQQVIMMDLNLFANKYSLEKDYEEWTIAIESLDDILTEDSILFVSNWFLAMLAQNNDFDFDSIFTKLQDDFNQTLYGGPTIYSIVESAVKRDIPFNYLYEENSFQWGLGKKQQRGRSTIFHSDGIKDTEFTTYKDMMGEFLDLCGFPNPQGDTCYEIEEVLEAVEKIGFPVVIKPVAGHKGQGVTTGIESIPEAKKAFNKITQAAKDNGVQFDGALVQQQIYGYDHRIITIGGKFIACLKREPAFVIGNGNNTIKELIDEDNKLEIRADTARSPLAKIHLDADMHDFLKLQGFTSDSVPAKDEKIVLRRVANISAGGVSFNVTDEMNPKNIEMAENISKFFNVTAMGIDVLAKDISKPWDEGDFGIIEINAGPGVFMHLAPAFGGSIDVPSAIMKYFFGNKPGAGRIPIIVGNYLTNEFIGKLYKKFKKIKTKVEFGSVRSEGVYFNNRFFTNNKHDENCKILFRNPKLDIAVLEHTTDDIQDFGTWHVGHDMAILEKPNYAEQILIRDLRPGGVLVIIEPENEQTDENILEDSKYKITLSIDEKVIAEKITLSKSFIESSVIKLIEPYFKNLLFKYDDNE